MKWSRTRPWAAAVAFVGCLARPAAAQIDYRNLDDGRPTRVTDAYPVERYAFEFSLPYGLSRAAGVTTHALAPHLEFGAGRNLMVGLGAEVARTPGEGVDVGGVDAGLLWNLRRETAALPALSFRAGYGVERFGDAGAGTLGLLATRSVGRYRVHLNASARVVGSDSGGTHAPKWWAGLALDRTLLRSSTLLVADLTTERLDAFESLVWRAGLGLRRQILPTWVLYGGLRQAFGDYHPTEITLGVSYSFAMAGLMRGGK